MKKAVSYAIGTVVLVSAGYAGASWYTGKQITDILETSANELKQYPMIKVTNRTMEKGLLQSTENVTYQIGCSAEPDFSVTLKNTIKHQPLNASMETTIQYDEKIRAKLKTIFNDQAPLTLHTTFGVGGKVNTDISSPKFIFERNGAKLESQGLNLKVESDKTFSFVNTQFNMGGLTGSDSGKMAFTLGKASYQGKQVLSSTGTYVGTDNGEIASANFMSNNNSFSLGKIRFSSSGSIKENFQNIVFKTDIDNIVFNKSTLGNLSSSTQLNHLDTKALTDINTLQIQSVKQMLQCKAAPDDAQARLAALSALFEQDPEFKFTLDVASDVGATQLTTSLNSKGLAAKDLQNFNDWKNKIQASIALKTPIAFVEKLLTLETDVANKENKLNVLHQRLDEASKLGFIVQDDKTIKFDAALKQGKTTLNGKPFNL